MAVLIFNVSIPVYEKLIMQLYYGDFFYECYNKINKNSLLSIKMLYFAFSW